MPRGHPVCMLTVCVVLMNATGPVYAQQAIGLRPSLDEDRLADDLPPPPEAPSIADDGLPPPPDSLTAAQASELEEVDSAELPPPPPPPEPVVNRPDVRSQQAVDQPEVTAPSIGPYEPLGLRVGAFRAYPSVAVTGVVTDNVRQTRSSRESDVGLRIAPELRLQSDWVRHSYSLNANGDLIFFADNSDFDELSANVTGDLRLDVRRSTTWETTGTYSLSQTSPSSSEVPDAASGRRTDQEFGLTTRLTHRAGRLAARISAGVRYLLFDDVSLAGGGTEDNSDRNYLEPTAELRLTYERSPAIRPFAEVRYQPRIHDRSVDRSGLRRDSHGGTLAAGVEFDLSPIWSGEIAVRYDIRDFEDSSLGTVHSGGVDARVVWRPSQLTTVRWNASSELDESASSGVSAVRSYSGTLEIEHALRENVIFTGSSGLGFDDRIGTDRDELRFDAGLAVSYLLSREAEVLARYDFTRFDTLKSNSDYYENRVSAGFRFRL